ncbi:MAG: OmpA domain protein [Cytophagales bacterium]|jgi:chemotaxis protein MotB|nr:OmpA family protein [Bacteroidota bacterium]MBS1981402.1 OmpA family protein [Bacteroidota bacterium]WHZ06783.1 MAG: OmpA domain protein [Cytophagales bacterium]
MIYRFITAIFISVIVSSCIVSKKKFDDMLAQKVKAEGELADKRKALDLANANISQLNESLKKNKKEADSLNESLHASNKKLADLNKDYEKLNANYKLSLTKSGKLNQDLSQQRDQLLTIQDNLEKTRQQNDSLSNSLAEREKKVKELEQVLAKKDKAVQDLKNRISNALLNFKENDLTVKVKNGKVYVSLAEQLLFGSGSIVVDKKGETALHQLAKAIKDQKDINMMIEGHTDNVPISAKTKYMEDNWDLSVLRATAITKILIKAGMSPNQITSAGRGEYSPVASNDNAQNKQKNRRTEIIVTPKLDELFKILDSN